MTEGLIDKVFVPTLLNAIDGYILLHDEKGKDMKLTGRGIHKAVKIEMESIKQLVIAEQERIVKELERYRIGHLEHVLCTEPLHKHTNDMKEYRKGCADTYEYAIRIVKGESI